MVIIWSLLDLTHIGHYFHRLTFSKTSNYRQLTQHFSRYGDNFVPPAPVSYQPVNPPDVPPEVFNNPQPSYQYRPAAGTSYLPSPSPLRSQCMYQPPLPRNQNPIVPNSSAMHFDNQQNWQVQPEPILEPIIVRLEDQQPQASSYYGGYLLWVRSRVGHLEQILVFYRIM